MKKKIKREKPTVNTLFCFVIFVDFRVAIRSEQFYYYFFFQLQKCIIDSAAYELDYPVSYPVVVPNSLPSRGNISFSGHCRGEGRGLRRYNIIKLQCGSKQNIGVPFALVLPLILYPTNFPPTTVAESRDPRIF